jgi:tetratricopeptide (TPR) repeat protein
MKHITFPLLFFVCLSADAQTYRQWLNAADEAFANQNYYASMKYYQEAMTIESEQPEVFYKYAEAARLFKAFTFADTAYTKVLASEQAKEYPLTKYWLATVKKEQGKYEEAQSLFRQFVNEHPNTHREYTAVATTEIETLDWAIQAIMQPDDNVVVERLGDFINTPNSEFSPLIRGNDLYYSSLAKELEDRNKDVPRPHAQAFRAKDAGRKIDPLEINDPRRHTAHVSFNKDNTRMYYSLCDWVGESAEIRCELWFRPIDSSGKYGEPVRLPDDINRSGYTTTDPSVSYDEATGREWLFFVSDRPGGQGKMDIWSAFFNPDGSFSKPVNLVDLNTSENDVTPFFHSLSKTLYFSADGRQGFGG